MKLYPIFRDLEDGQLFMSTDRIPLRCIKLPHGPYGTREDTNTPCKCNAFCFDTNTWRLFEHNEAVCHVRVDVSPSPTGVFYW